MAGLGVAEGARRRLHCRLQRHVDSDRGDRRGRARRIFGEEPLRDVENPVKIPVAEIAVELADVGVGYGGAQHDIGP